MAVHQLLDVVNPGCAALRTLWWGDGPAMLVHALVLQAVLQRMHACASRTLKASGGAQGLCSTTSCVPMVCLEDCNSTPVSACVPTGRHVSTPLRRHGFLMTFNTFWLWCVA
jgi:hypothetical protein